MSRDTAARGLHQWREAAETAETTETTETAYVRGERAISIEQ